MIVCVIHFYFQDHFNPVFSYELKSHNFYKHSIYSSKNVYESMYPIISSNDYTIKEAGHKGLGLFTLKNITNGTFVGCYEGELLTAKDYMKRYPKGDSVYTFQLNEGQRRDILYLDARDPEKSNLMRYINHDKYSPNLDVSIDKILLNNKNNKSKYTYKYEVRFYALRDIEINEELLFDYGDKYPI
jgi:SET domain-containing protein